MYNQDIKEMLSKHSLDMIKGSFYIITPDGKKKPMKQNILGAVSDLVSNFVYYDRKECEVFSRGDLIDAIKSNEISLDEIVGHFKSELTKAFYLSGD